jgi:hypothetical protein
MFAVVKTPRNWKLGASATVPLAGKLGRPQDEPKRTVQPVAAKQDVKPKPATKAKPSEKSKPDEKARPESKAPGSSKSKPDETSKADQARLKKVELIRDEERSPLRPAELEECVRQLRSGDDVVITAALEKLALALPDPAHTKRMVREAQNFLPRRDNPLLGRMAMFALQNWDKASRITNDLRAAAAAGKRLPVDFTKLDNEISSGDYGKAVDAIEYLGTTRDPRAADILVKHYERQTGRCADALRALGPIAAPAVVRLLESREITTRIKAAEILRDIGTANQLDPLQKASSDSSENAMVRKKADEAISRIKRRK